MTYKDILITRVIIAKSINVSPDSIKVVNSKNKEDENTLYVIDDFKEVNMVLCFKEIPTIVEAREAVKDCYLAGCEWNFDFECK